MYLVPTILSDLLGPIISKSHFFVFLFQDSPREAASPVRSAACRPAALPRIVSNSPDESIV